MPFTMEVSAKVFTLPDDADAAREEFLSQLKNPNETYIIAYALTMGDLADELIASHNAGVPIHLYVDHSQTVGAYQKPIIQKLADAGLDVTIGTSTFGQAFICHTKAVVVLNPSPDGPWCWTGSVNFSKNGWEQANEALAFVSQPWADQFLAAFQKLKSYAWASEAPFQLYASPR